MLAGWVVGRLMGGAWAWALVVMALLGSGSVLLHEWGHLWALQLTAGSPAVAEVSVLRSWGSASLLRPSLPRRAERWVAAAGPLAGTASGLPLLGFPLPVTVRTVLLVPFGFHLLALAPCFSDGRNFWSAHD
jgi:hypothetical protein